MKPPPAVPGTHETGSGLNPTQKRMIWGAVFVLLLVAGGWYAYSYWSSAPERAQKQFEAGMAKMAPGSYPEAVQAFTRAIEISPQIAQAYLERGNAESALGNTEAAIADYDQAIDMGNLAAALTARGRIYLSKGDNRRAAADFAKSVTIEPSSDAYYQLGQISEASGDHAKAIEQYTQAIHVQPDSPFVYRARALSRQLSGDEDGALEDRTTALAIERKSRRR